MPISVTPGVNQYYEEQGRGEPVIFLHHYFATMSAWQAQRDALGRYFRVIAVDARGHGQTPFPGGRIRVSELSGDIEGLIAFLGLEQAHIVGSSLGGLVALHLACNQPGIVRSLTVVGPPHVTEPSAVAYADRFIEEIFPASEMRLAREHAHQPAGHVRDVLLHNFALDRESFPQDMIEVVEHADQIACPTLVVAGDNDPVFPAMRAVELAARIPKGELCILPKGTHLPHRAMPAIFTGILLDFLSRVG